MGSFSVICKGYRSMLTSMEGFHYICCKDKKQHLYNESHLYIIACVHVFKHRDKWNDVHQNNTSGYLWIGEI